MTITSTARGEPTIVLVHGAFAESASWDGIITKLLADGYPATLVDLIREAATATED